MNFKIIVITTFILLSCTKQSEKEFSITDDTVMAVLYHQKAAEVKALQYQAFMMAKEKLNRVKNQVKDLSNKAVVVDIDETVLDNSPYTAKQVFTRTSYPIDWDLWVKKEIAKAIPGSLDFLNHADKLGFTIFYISNRKAHLYDATVNNLNALNYPQVKKEQILLRTGSSDKEERRQKVRENYDIVLFVGDNLGDFSSKFDKADQQKRDYYTTEFKNKFGEEFFVLPNSLYGAWLSAVLQATDSTDLLKSKRIKEALEIYEY